MLKPKYEADLMFINISDNVVFKLISKGKWASTGKSYRPLTPMEYSI